MLTTITSLRFYRPMLRRARLWDCMSSVCPSVTFRYRVQIGFDFALTYNFQGTHISGASRSHLCDSVILLFYFLIIRKFRLKSAPQIACLPRSCAAPNCFGPTRTIGNSIDHNAWLLCYQRFSSYPVHAPKLRALQWKPVRATGAY